MQNQDWVSSVPEVCSPWSASQVTCGLLLLAAAHLSAPSESRELLQNTTPTSRDRNLCVVSSQPVTSQNFSGFTNLLRGWDRGQFVFCFSSPGPLESSEDSLEM